MITNGTVPAKEFEGKLWVLADAYQQLMQAAYTGGVYAEREACAAILRKWIDSFNYEPEMDEILAEILARGQL